MATTRVSSTQRVVRLFLNAAILSGPLLLLTGCLPVEEAVGEAPKPRAVRVESVAFEARPTLRSFPATIRARIESDLAFRVGGKVVARIVNVGDRVKAGQPMALLDDTDFKLQVESAEAELNAAHSALAQ